VSPIVARGVRLDVGGLDGGPHRAAGRVVTAGDLARAGDAAAIALSEGDVVLIRTGWGRYFWPRHCARPGGRTWHRWARRAVETALGLVAIGADTMAVEVLPNPARGMPVNQHARMQARVFLIGNPALDELGCARVGGFCFLLLAAIYQGATGCPVARSRWSETPALRNGDRRGPARTRASRQRKIRDETGPASTCAGHR